ncbi:TraR/DksA C4-type zinc finger protein [Sporosalibacterium faouarense]|uniref:TraR/DksA C4-type zinc finger protein n=1 Tax=Sporosalibacterium faouarense TaxID=516123 RepID=UPI00192BF6CB|nr:TraR/DksA C4-type zinc finger protein [Sporosalibacterium faouarense]
MDKNKLEFYKNKLMQEKKDALESIDKMKKGYPDGSMPEYFDELSMYDNHPADLGTEMFMAEQGMNLENVERLTLREIEDSLDKIERGTYGECDICGKEISDDRLDFLPHAKLCIECANDKIPIDEMMDKRPVEEYNLNFPFGRTNNDISGDDSVEFDGEDSYQAVARFNEIQDDPSDQGGFYQGVFDDKEPGIVEDVENISEGYYKGQLEGMNREDIPDEQKIKKDNDVIDEIE